jgi:endo-beta-N-acetylglucosaminidase D
MSTRENKKENDMEWMTRTEIMDQVNRLNERVIKNLASDEPMHQKRAIRLANEAKLLKYAADNATDEELRLAQIVLPGRGSVMLWAEKQIKEA